ncbi:MAG: 3-methyl-2-oxobutanoate hydroxymethyltransferase [Acidobacteriia bacterium]|nr:3-methyl-2-oxobutanoate hydroxymethyltransferase [Terriglobia bacterium]
MDPHSEAVSKVTVPLILDRKLRGEKITCLTAYDYPTARLVDEAGIDMILVGDSLAQVVLGYDSTIPVTLEEMLHHLRAVRRATRRALLIVDLPYGTYHVGEEETLRASIRCLKEGGAEAVTIEGGKKRAALIRRLVEAEIPVMGHIGLTPQSVHSFGGYRVQGRTLESALELLADAQAVEDAGAFALVLEGIPRELAALITGRLRIPTVGIGAGPDCDGQVLVVHDLLGLSFSPRAKFVRSYADLAAVLRDAFARFRDDVLAGRYPADAESYHWSASLREQFEKEVATRSLEDEFEG